MENEDLYPNDSSYFLPTEPPDQIVSRKKEKAKTLEGLSVLQETIKRLDEQITFLGSIDAMPAELKTQPTKFMVHHNANEIARNILRAERDYLEDLVMTYAPNR